MYFYLGIKFTVMKITSKIFLLITASFIIVFASYAQSPIKSSQNSNVFVQNGDQLNSNEAYGFSNIYDYNATSNSPVQVIVTSDPNVIVPRFDVNSQLQCFTNNYFIFTNASSSKCGCLTYVWNFGDGSISTLISPNHSYAAVGEYVVKLVATDDLGNKDSVKTTIKIVNGANTNFTINPTSVVCFNGNNKINFTNTTSGGSGILYTWNLGNGVTTNEKNPTNYYTKAGTYNITLSTTIDGVCPASSTKQLVINPTPKANFTYKQDGANASKIVFSNSSNENGSPANYKWFFGDNNSGIEKDPTNIYAASGIYNVILEAGNEFGCNDTTIKTVIIGNETKAGFIGIGSGTQCLSGNKFSFTSTSIGANNSTLTHAWNFGDGTSSTFANPSKIYGNAGTYTVTLTITASNGDVNTTSANINILISPNAVFNVNRSKESCISSNNVFQFTPQIIEAAYDYLWDLGNGRISNTKKPTGDYNTAGNYIVSLTVGVPNGCSATSYDTIKMFATPVVNFSNDVDKNNYKKISFTNQSSISNGSATYVWNLGESVTAITTNASHTYVNEGTFNITLLATSVEHGCSANTVIPVIIKDSLLARIDINNICQCLDVNGFKFVNESHGGVGPYTYVWNFGDGTTSTLEYPSKTYTLPGDYVVSLTVTSANNKSAATTLAIQVADKPKASFNYKNTSNNNYDFTNKSTITFGAISDYYWDFGDGNHSALSNPSNTYNANGTYIVTLIIKNSKGCADTTRQTITTNSSNIAICNLVVDFTVNNPRQCVYGNNFILTNSSTGGTAPYTYLWDLNDGTSQSTKDASRVYATYGEHDITLKVSDSKGCENYITRQIYVGDKPASSFNVLNNTLNGQSKTFISTSTVVLGPITYLWDLGNGTTSTLVNPTVTYNPGTYIVKLTVTGIGTCVDETSQTVTQTSTTPVVANFNYTGNNCSNNNNQPGLFTFTNLSNGGTGTLTYAWNFGDGTTSTQKNPTKSYLYPNTYTVNLTVTDAVGSQASAHYDVQSLGGAKPVASFNILTNTLNGASYSFISTSTISSGYMNYSWDLGNGATSTLVNPTITYSAIGTYNVKLVCTGNSGCKDSITKSVTVISVGTNSVAIQPPVVSVFPNPVTDAVQVTFRAASATLTTIKIMDVSGRVLKVQSVQPVANGTNIITLVDTRGIQSGSYIIYISDVQNGFVGSKQILKQ